MTPFPFYKNMLNISGWSCSYKNGALLAKFQPGVLNPFVLICGCLLYSQAWKFHQPQSKTYNWNRLTFLNKDLQFLGGLEEVFRGNSRIISDCQPYSILKTLSGCLCASRNFLKFDYWSWRSKWIVQPYLPCWNLQPLSRENQKWIMINSLA